MGFDKLGESRFAIPVSTTKAYQQFCDYVVVPHFEAIAELMQPRILEARRKLAERKRTAC